MKRSGDAGGMGMPAIARSMLLGDVVRFGNGKSIKPGGEGCYPVYGSNGIIGGCDEFRYKNGVIIGRVGAYCGSVIYCPDKFWASDNTLVAFPASDQIDTKFLFYLLSDAKLSRYAGGAAQPLVTQTVLKQVEVNVPPLQVQQRIAGILSAYDELIENSQRRIRILEAMARAIYREWFIHFRFPGHDAPSSPSLLPRGEGCQNPPSPSGRGAGGEGDFSRITPDLSDIPKVWELKRLPECVDFNPRVVVPREGEKPFVPMGCLSNDSMLISNIESRTGNSGAKFQNDDTLFARITPCLENGKTGFVQFLPYSQAVAFGSTEYIVLRSRTLTPEFVYLLARSDEFRGHAIKSMSGASGRQRVQEKCFNDFQIAQPPKALLDQFSAIVAPSFRQIYKLHLQIQNLSRTRDLLLPRLLSGQTNLSEVEIAK